MSIKVSVVMPVYNSEKTIAFAIESVLSQTYQNFELVIIDGGSYDSTRDIVQSYKEKVDIFISEKDKGYADALNKGIKAASGEYYIMLAADDYLLENALQDFISEVKENTDVWCGNMYCFKEGNNITRFNRTDDVNEIKRGKVLAHPACVFKRQSFEKYGYYDVGLPVNSDREILLRWLNQGANFQLSQKYITLFYCGGMSTQCANNRNINELTDGEKVSIKYGLNPQEARKIMKKDNKRRDFGKIIKSLFSKNHIVMYIIFLVDGQKPLTQSRIKELKISENYLKRYDR